MSDVDNEIKRLSDAAIDIALIANPKTRHEGGWWLNSQLVSLYESHLFTHEQRLDFMAVVRVLLDVIFRDAIEGDQMIAGVNENIQDQLREAGVSIRENSVSMQTNDTPSIS